MAHYNWWKRLIKSLLWVLNYHLDNYKSRYLLHKGIPPYFFAFSVWNGVNYAWKVGVKHTAIYWLEGPIFITVCTSFCICLYQIYQASAQVSVCAGLSGGARAYSIRGGIKKVQSQYNCTENGMHQKILRMFMGTTSVTAPHLRCKQSSGRHKCSSRRSGSASGAAQHVYTSPVVFTRSLLLLPKKPSDSPKKPSDLWHSCAENTYLEKMFRRWESFFCRVL